MSVIRGASIYAQVYKPNQYGQYAITVAVDKETANNLKKEGIKVKPAATLEFKDGSNASQFGEFVVKIKQKIEGKDFVRPPTVVDAQLQPFSELIGNGSIVEVQYKPRDWTFGSNRGITADLKAVKVVKHVPYVEQLEFSAEPGVDSSDVDTGDSPFN